MRPITYSLTPGSSSSSAAYYADVSRFTDVVLETAESHTAELVDTVMRRVRATRCEALRSREEYLLDIMMLGVMWREYAGRSENLSPLAASVLTRLYDLRRRNAALKPSVDRLRGVLATMFLLDRPVESSEAPTPSSYRLSRLLEYLTATGEYRQEVKRLRTIQAAMVEYQPVRFLNVFESLITLTEWFERASVEELGAYTANVDDYVARRAGDHRWKEDVLFCSRRRIEYHLAMVGAEIMNRALRPTFELADDKVVLLPACMRARPEGECEARSEGLDSICTGCTPGCHVHQTVRLGVRRGFAVRMIGHSSDFSRWLSEKAVGRNVGVVGVACPLNLIAGGLELRAQDVAAQCVLLDECGCSSHWHDEGVPTSLDLPVLQRTIERREDASRAA